MALRCLQSGFRLVADDRVIVWRSAGALYGKAPISLNGLIEVRGVGVINVEPPLPFVEIRLVLDLAPSVERTPEPLSTEIAGVRLPQLILNGQDVDLPLRLSAALAAMQHRI